MIPADLFTCEVCDRIHGSQCKPAWRDIGVLFPFLADPEPESLLPSGDGWFGLAWADDDPEREHDISEGRRMDMAHAQRAVLDAMDAPDILYQARNIVRNGAGAGHANREPGAVEMERLGRVWGALLDTGPIPARTVALMMTGMKLVRGTKRTDLDDLIDAAGYLLIASDAE